jgi:hypothetical protein
MEQNYYENLEFIDPDKILNCEICKKVMKEPIESDCGYTFCKFHLARVGDSETVFICPLCSKISCENKDCPSIKRKINNTMIKCCYPRCKYECLYKDFDNHIKINHMKLEDPFQQMIMQRINNLEDEIEQLKLKLTPISEKQEIEESANSTFEKNQAKSIEIASEYVAYYKSHNNSHPKQTDESDIAKKLARWLSRIKAIKHGSKKGQLYEPVETILKNNLPDWS